MARLSSHRAGNGSIRLAALLAIGWFSILATLNACTLKRQLVGDGSDAPGSTTGSETGPSTYTAKAPPTGAMPPAWPQKLPGLRARVFRYGSSQLVSSPPTSPELQQLAAAISTAAPDYTFIDQVMGVAGGLHFEGVDNTPVNTYFSPDATGPLSVLADPLRTTVVDWSGFVYIPTPGSYDFNIILGDDAAAVYINGTGATGSGMLVAQRNYARLLNSNSPVYFNAAGDYPFELFYVNQVLVSLNGGAALYLDVTGPGAVTFSSLDSSDLSVSASLGIPNITLGNAQIVSVPGMQDPNMYNVVNGSVFAWLPNEDATAMLTFFVSGNVARSVSPDLLHGGTTYNQQEPDLAGYNTETVLPGLSSSMAECKLSFNTYLNMYVLVWRADGENTIRPQMSSSRSAPKGHRRPSAPAPTPPTGTSRSRFSPAAIPTSASNFRNSWGRPMCRKVRHRGWSTNSGHPPTVACATSWCAL